MLLFRTSRFIATRTINFKTLPRRSFAPFSSTTAAMSTISDVIKDDHRELEEYYQKIIDATDDDTKTRYQNQFTWELARHAVGEELVVYPAMEKYMGAQGKTNADKDRKEHQKTKEQLQKFQGLEASSSEFIPTLKALMADLADHIKDEERDDLPALEKAIASSDTSTDTESLATSFNRTKMFVPTRSHPSAPDKPPFETVVSLMAAPIDHLTDLFRKFPQ